MSLLQGKWIDSIFVQEVPSGTVNGVNDQFTLTNEPHSIDQLSITVNGIVKKATIEFTLSGSVVTLIEPPVLGQEVYAIYIKRD